MRLIVTSLLFAAVVPVIGGPRAAFAQSRPAARTGAQSSYVLVTTSTTRIHNDLTFQIKAPKLAAVDWVVYLPRLPELAGQTQVRSSTDPRGRTVHELGPMGRSLLRARVPVTGAKWRSELTVRVEYEATLLARRLERRKPGTPPAPVAPINPRERRFALAEGHQFDFGSTAFQAWLDDRGLRRKPDEEEVDLARRVFAEMKKRFHLIRTANDMDRLASHVCEASRSDVGGLAIAYVSALRANRIPARVLGGRWARPSESLRNAAEDVHVQAEFFAAGVGWVPVDIGSALHSEESADGLEYFGQDKGDFLTWHVDTDIEMDTIHFGPKTVEWLQSPAIWVSGTGTFEGFAMPATSLVRIEPPQASRRPQAPRTGASPSRDGSMPPARGGGLTEPGRGA